MKSYKNNTSKHLTSHIPSLTSRYCHPERSAALLYVILSVAQPSFMSSWA